MFDLLRSRRFGPLFATQFLGAFNDNLFKTALLFAVTFRLARGDAAAATLVSAAAGVFILPFFLFSGWSGQLSDTVDKARVMRGVKLAELAILAVGAGGLALGSVPLLFAALFAMGCHSAVFGPVKYAVLPQHLASGDLLRGTGLVEGGTFVAILLGQVAGGLLPTSAASVLMLLLALAGIAASRQIPPAPPFEPGRVDRNPWTASRAVLRGAFSSRRVACAVLAISWFWAVGTVYTAEFVPLVKGVLGASPAVATLFLGTFTVGIAAGSVAAARIAGAPPGAEVSTRAVPFAALAMAAASLDLWHALGAARDGGPAGFGGATVAAFVAAPGHIHILADLFVLAVAGGIFSVPLYAVLQTATAAASRSRAVAANNIVNAGFQVGAALLAGLAVARGTPIPAVLAVAGASGVLLWPLLRRLDDTRNVVDSRAASSGNSA